MISRTWSRKSIAFCVAIAVLSVYSMISLAAPQQGQTAPSGELSTSGQVTVNGQPAISGTTFYTNSTVTVGPNSSAVLSLGKQGRIELMQNSSMKITFDNAGISGTLDAGRARLSTPAGTSVNISTKDGSVVADNTQASVFTVDVECGNTQVATASGQVELRAGDKVQQIAAGQDAQAGTVAPGTRCTRLEVATRYGHLSGGALAALLIALGGGVAAIILASRHNNDLNFGGGNVTVVSPTR
jgi:hypothetical protein